LTGTGSWLEGLSQPGDREPYECLSRGHLSLTWYPGNGLNRAFKQQARKNMWIKLAVQRLVHCPDQLVHLLVRVGNQKVKALAHCCISRKWRSEKSG
jgi:hypothetical protein